MQIAKQKKFSVVSKRVVPEEEDLIEKNQGLLL